MALTPLRRWKNALSLELERVDKRDGDNGLSGVSDTPVCGLERDHALPRVKGGVQGEVLLPKSVDVLGKRFLI